MIGSSSWTVSSFVTALILLVCACAPSGHVTPLGRLPPDVHVTLQETEYPVTGGDEAAIGRSIDARGPRSSTGRPLATFFRWGMESSYTWQATEGGCAMREVEIRVTASVTMPRWEPPPGAPTPLVASWNRYVTALHVHEEGHRDHVLRAATELRRELMRLERDNCSFMLGDAEELHDRILREWKRVDMEYEIETENGRTQGAVWPPGG